MIGVRLSLGWVSGQVARSFSCAHARFGCLSEAMISQNLLCRSHAGAAVTKWGIEYERPASAAFKVNNPEVRQGMFAVCCLRAGCACCAFSGCALTGRFRAPGPALPNLIT